MSFLEKIAEFFGFVDRQERKVTVVKGDSLWAIAERVTGDGERWRELVEANPDRAFGQNYVIQPGEELVLPESWCKED